MHFMVPGDLPQWLRVLAALARGHGFSSQYQHGASKPLITPVQGGLAPPFLSPWILGMRMVHMHTGKLLIKHKKKQNLFLKKNL